MCSLEYAQLLEKEIRTVVSTRRPAVVVLFCFAGFAEAPPVAPQLPSPVIYINGGENVVNPTLTVYLPDPAKANGAAVILCPGDALRTELSGGSANRQNP